MGPSDPGVYGGSHAGPTAKQPGCQPNSTNSIGANAFAPEFSENLAILSQRDGNRRRRLRVMTGFQDSISFEQRITEQLLPHQGFARRLARGLLFDEHQADDVVQQAWLAALETPPSINPRGWLTRVVQGRARDVHRERTRRVRRERATARDEALPPTDEVLAREDERRKIVDAVRTLPEPYRQAIVLRYLEERSPKEIGEALGMPAATVRSHVKRGLDRLRELLDERHGGDRRGWMLALIPLAKPTALVKSAGLGAVPLAVVGSWWLWVMKKALWMVPLALVGWLAVWALLEDGSAARSLADGDPAGWTADPPAPEAVEQPGVEVRNEGVVRAPEASLPAVEVPDSITAAMAQLTGRVLLPGGAGPVVGATVVLTSMDGARLTAGLKPLDGPDAHGVLQARVATDEEGRFVFGRVWPGVTSFLRIEPKWIEGMPALRARTELLDVTPSPGAVIDLGEFRLAVGGSICGRVLDDQGAPIAGALVWAAPVPTMLSNLLPWDAVSFHPTGSGQAERLSFIAPLPRIEADGDGPVQGNALNAVRAYYGKMVGGRFLARGLDPADPAHDLTVIDAPSAMVRGLAGVGIASARSAADGSFVLAGLPATDHVVVARQPGRAGKHRGGVAVPRSGLRNIGVMKLRAGESLRGIVRDATGRPVDGAEVRVAPLGRRNYLGIGLVHAVHSTGADGRFVSPGLHRGRALVAVRRHSGADWTVAVAEVRDEVSIALPVEHVLELEVVSGGQAVAAADVRLRVQRGPWLTELQAFDFGRRIESRPGRGHSGHVRRVESLSAGRYTIEVGAPGSVSTVVAVTVPRSEPLRVELLPARSRVVTVVDPDGQPVVGATVFGRADEIPSHRQRLRSDSLRALSTRSGPEWGESAAAAGTTDRAGRAELEGLPAAACWVGATHPGFIAAQVPAPAGKPAVRVQLQRGGRLVGRIDAESAGQWSVRLESDSTVQTPGDLRPVGAMVVRPRKDSTFAFEVVPPGSYQVIAEPRMPQEIGLDQVFARAIYAERPMVRRSVTIVAGQTSEVVLSQNRGEGHVSGRLTINGAAPAPGLRVGIQQERREPTRYYPMQRDGSFAVSGLAARSSLLSFSREGEPVLYSQSIEIEPKEPTVVAVDLETGGLEGVILFPDGKPAAGVLVRLQGSIGGRASGQAAMSGPADQEGRFHFDQLPAGLYVITAVRDGLAAKFKPQRVAAGAVRTCEPVRMARVFTVIGRVEGGGGAQPIRIALQREGFSTRFVEIALGGQFGIAQVPPGTYRARIMVRSGIQMSTRLLTDVIEVRKDRRGLVLKIE